MAASTPARQLGPCSSAYATATEDGTEVLASEFFDEDDPTFDYRLGEPVKVSWVDGWEWLLPTEPEALPEEEGTDA